MLINLRNALMAGKRLPYDAEVEFLESTGTQYVETGVVPDRNTKISVTTAVTATTEQFMGAIDASTNRFHFSFYSAGHFRGCVGKEQTSMGSADQLIHTFALDAPNNTVSEDGTSYSFTTTGLVPSVSIWLFGRNSDNSSYVRRIKVRIYSCQIWQNGTLVRDYIPVRKGTTGELYDRVSGKFAERHGDFVLGPDVVPVEYLESDGRQYIDTGVKFNSTTAIQLKAKATTYHQFEAIFGAFASNAVGNRAFIRWLYQTQMQIAWFSTSSYSPTLTSYQDEITLAISPTGGTLNGTSFSLTRSSATLPTTQNCWLFAASNDDGTGRGWRGKCWYCYVNEGATPVRKLLPVRVGTEGAMMDVLTRRIYRNAGTGAFGYGNDLKYPIPAE